MTQEDRSSSRPINISHLIPLHVIKPTIGSFSTTGALKDPSCGVVIVVLIISATLILAGEG